MENQIDKKENKKKLALYAAVLVGWVGVVILSVIFITGFTACAGMKPVIIEGYPKECNLAFTAMRFYKDSKDKSGAVPYNTACLARIEKLNARKEFQDRKEECLNRYFPDKKIDYDNSKTYRNYVQCLSEK